MGVKELVFISGKGGTGKTTITSSFIPHFQNIVVADCDVDAPDLHILLKPTIESSVDFIATSKAIINSELCTNCGRCIDICNFDAISSGDKHPIIQSMKCEGCNTCTLVCNQNAISLFPHKTGEIFKSETEYAPMIHGRLTPGEEVSGRLVSEVRKIAKQRAKNSNLDLVILDGPPGIACNVISAITGSNLAVIVTEPTVSGLHDLKRVYNLAKKLSVPIAVIINRDGLSKEYSKKIEEFTKENDVELLGRIPLSAKILISIKKREIPIIPCEFMVNRIKEMLYI